MLGAGVREKPDLASCRGGSGLGIAGKQVAEEIET